MRDAEVNRLVLVNNSKRPLLLLAGEIVTGGKQDRVIGKDRIVPAESDPVDLSVFCVEPGRWVAANGKNEFSAGRRSRRCFRFARRARQVRWRPRISSRSGTTCENRSRRWRRRSMPAPAAAEVNSTTSYARVMDNKEVQQKVDAVAEPVQRNYESVIRQLRDKNAVGVVVAVNGEIVWADIFASTQLLQKYWPKLVRSYATEAVVTRAKGGEASLKDAQKFLDDLQGRHETAETEPGRLSSDGNHRRRLQGVRANVAAAEDGLRGACRQDGRLTTFSTEGNLPRAIQKWQSQKRAKFSIKFALRKGRVFQRTIIAKRPGALAKLLAVFA